MFYGIWSSAQAAKRVAAKVEEVRVATEKSSAIRDEGSAKLEQQLVGIAKVGQDTHTLVNSNMGAQLKISSVALRRLADLTKDAVDIKVANAAEALLEEHVAKQAQVDASGTDKLAEEGA